MEIMQKNGFGIRRMRWMHMIMDSRQGIPLQKRCEVGRPSFPVAFLIAADLLQPILNKVETRIFSGFRFNNDTDKTSP